MLVKRPWGTYEVLYEKDNFKCKRIDVEVNEELSYQSHQYREEVWSCVKGQGIITLDDKRIVFLPSDVIHIPQGSKHRIKNVGVTVLTFTEVQLGSSFDENDIIRYEDKYGRIK